MQYGDALNSDTYHTIESISTGLFKDRGSKFFGFAYPVQTLDDVKQALESLKKEYYDARHHCYAYRIKPESPEFRANDDGEPSNTAGMPIYNQILSHDLWNVLIIVVRYFGGTKLGASGLINAYKESASLALSEAVTLEKYLMESMQIQFPYELTNDVMRIIKDTGALIREEQMGQLGGYSLEIRKGEFGTLTQRFEQLHRLKIL